MNTVRSRYNLARATFKQEKKTLKREFHSPVEELVTEKWMNAAISSEEQCKAVLFYSGEFDAESAFDDIK